MNSPILVQDRISSSKILDSKIALVDGDGFLYRAGFAVERTKYLVMDKDPVTDNAHYCYPAESAADAKKQAEDGGIIWSRRELGTLEDACRIMDDKIKEALDATGCKDYYVYLSPSHGNFRDSVATIKKYKGNRDSTSRPYYYSDLREYCISRHLAIVARGEEADDQISWVARLQVQKGREFCIVGVDKDLLQIPGEHYDWVEKKTEHITEEESRLWYWAQVLAGDPGDHVGGCWGMGVKKAMNFLLRCDDLSDEAVWPKIVEKYGDSQFIDGCPYKHLFAEDVALETLRLIRLKQTMNETLWTPPKTRQEGNKDVGKKERKKYARAARAQESRKQEAITPSEPIAESAGEQEC